MARSTAAATASADALKTLMEVGIHYRHIKTGMERDVLVITITSSQVLDDMLADGFTQELLAAAAQAAHANVALDFHAVTAICTGVFRSLLELNSHVQKKGGRLALCGLSPAVEEVFHLAGLVDGVGAPFEICPQPEAAIASLSTVGQPFHADSRSQAGKPDVR
jgi:anti-anti-sigma factor